MKKFALSLMIFNISCMPNIEDDKGVDAPIVMSHSIVKATSTTDIRLEGKCPTNASRIYVAIDQKIFVGATSPDSNPNIVKGNCTNGSFSLIYAVSTPSVSREIKFYLRAANTENEMSAIVEYAMNYIRPSEAVPGFSIASVGGIIFSTPSPDYSAITNGGGSAIATHHTGAHIGLGVGSSPANVIVRPNLIGILIEN